MKEPSPLGISDNGKKELVMEVQNETPVVEGLNENYSFMNIVRSEEERTEIFDKVEKKSRSVSLGTSECGDLARGYEISGHYDRAAEYYLMHPPSIPQAMRLFIEKNIDKQAQEEIREKVITRLESAAKSCVEKAEHYNKKPGLPPFGLVTFGPHLTVEERRNLENLEGNAKFYQSIANTIRGLDFNKA